MRNDLNLKPEQIDKIEVHTYKLAVGSHDHAHIMGISSAKLSTPYAVALAIVLVVVLCVCLIKKKPQRT